MFLEHLLSHTRDQGQLREQRNSVLPSWDLCAASWYFLLSENLTPSWSCLPPPMCFPHGLSFLPCTSTPRPDINRMCKAECAGHIPQERHSLGRWEVKSGSLVVDHVLCSPDSPLGPKDSFPHRPGLLQQMARSCLPLRESSLSQPPRIPYWITPENDPGITPFQVTSVPHCTNSMRCPYQTVFSSLSLFKWLHH